MSDIPDREQNSPWLNEEPEAAGESFLSEGGLAEGGKPVKPEIGKPDLKGKLAKKKSIAVPAVAAVAVVVAAALGSYFFFIAQDKAKPPVKIQEPVVMPQPAVNAPVAGGPVAGIPATEVAPQSTEAQAAARPAKKAGKQVAERKYFVQIGSFTEKDNAVRLTATLKKRGYKVFVSEGALNGKTVHRVLAGGFTKKDNACKLADKLSLKEGLSTSIHAEWTAVNPG